MSSPSKKKVSRPAKSLFDSSCTIFSSENASIFRHYRSAARYWIRSLFVQLANYLDTPTDLMALDIRQSHQRC